MLALKKIFVAGYVGIIVMFGIAAFGLLGFTAIELWQAFNPMQPQALTDRFNSVLKAIAMLTIALAALDLADTVIEEEFKREGHLNGTVTRAGCWRAFWWWWWCRCRSSRWWRCSSSCTTRPRCCPMPPPSRWAQAACWSPGACSTG